MAEYCRDCSIRYLGPETAKYAGGLCKRGETTTMLCEGCGDIVDVDHEGRRVDKGAVMPDRDRWSAWVNFAWLLAILACIGGVAVIAMAGFIEVPRENRFGRIETVREANLFIWSLGIGQAVSALLLAALFSMVNDIYKNSCSLLGVQPHNVDSDTNVVSNGSWPGSQTALQGHTGPKVVKISDKSPLFDKVYADWSLAEINGRIISASNDIKKVIRPGENNFTFTKPDGEQVSIIAKVASDLRLHMTLSR